MAENGPGPDPIGTDDPRLRALDERLKRAQAAETRRTGADKAVGTESYNLGNRVLAELLGGMIGGALIGWVLDRLFGTSPWLLLTLLFLGIGVAFRNIYRISQRPVPPGDSVTKTRSK